MSQRRPQLSNAVVGAPMPLKHTSQGYPHFLNTFLSDTHTSQRRVSAAPTSLKHVSGEPMPVKHTCQGHSDLSNRCLRCPHTCLTSVFPDTGAHETSNLYLDVRGAPEKWSEHTYMSRAPVFRNTLPRNWRQGTHNRTQCCCLSFFSAHPGFSRYLTRLEK